MFNKKFFLFFLAFILVLSFISAAPKVPTQAFSGLGISYPFSYYIPQGENLAVRWWVYNVTDGSVMTNTTTNCTFNLLNNTGYNIVKTTTLESIKFGIPSNPNACQNCFNVVVDKGNFSYNGLYEFQIRCQARGNLGGYFSGEYEVNTFGKEFTLQKVLIDILVLLFLFGFFIGFLILGIMLPSNNQTDEMTGYIIAVSNMKYLKFFLLGLAWITNLGISYFVWMLSYSYLDMDYLTTILRFIFYSLTILTLPLFILYVYLTIANLVRDSKVSEALSYGIKTKE